MLISHLFAVLPIRDWGSRLKNRFVKLNDAGAYTCVANNSLGTARIQAFLVVNGMFTGSILNPQLFYQRQIIFYLKLTFHLLI